MFAGSGHDVHLRQRGISPFGKASLGAWGLNGNDGESTFGEVRPISIGKAPAKSAIRVVKNATRAGGVSDFPEFQTLGHVPALFFPDAPASLNALSPSLASLVIIGVESFSSCS
jgi:hypothetical protein